MALEKTKYLSTQWVAIVYLPNVLFPRNYLENNVFLKISREGKGIYFLQYGRHVVIVVISDLSDIQLFKQYIDLWPSEKSIKMNMKMDINEREYKVKVKQKYYWHMR